MRYAFLLLLLLAAGCDSGGDDALRDGRFAGTVRGARDLSLGGRALFSVEPELGLWGLLLLDGPGRVVSASVFRDAPTVGAVGIPETAVARLSEFTGASGAEFEATGGLLTVAEVSDHVVRGTLAFEGESETGERVSAEVAFAAARLVVPTGPLGDQTTRPSAHAARPE